jgi:glycerol-3-phosphate dehydrogenase
VDAAQRGAQILTRTACMSARREGKGWLIELRDAHNGTDRVVFARALVNAAGPWVADIIERVAGARSTRKVRLVKGSHIVTPKFWDGPHSYLVQNHDKRVIFINPYEGDKALIGTTDVPWLGAPENVEIDEAEIDYLLAAVNRYFKQPLRREDVVQTFSGVRPLYDDGKGNPSAVTRDYVFDLDTNGGAPLLNVFGGKITTFRKLSEHAMQHLRPTFPDMGQDWTATATLPGGEINEADVPQFIARLQREYLWLPRDLMRHYARTYGARTERVINSANSLADLGRQFGPNFYEAEVRYLMEQEWAETAQDILTRRTKHGLHMTAEQTAAFDGWLNGLDRKSA